MRWRDDPRLLLLGGVVLLLIGIASLLTGETFTMQRYTDQYFVERSKEPKKFWLLVALYLIGGLVFIGLYVSRISN